MPSPFAAPDDALLRTVMRLHGEPCVYVDEWRVHALLTAQPKDYYAFVKQGLERIARAGARSWCPPLPGHLRRDGSLFSHGARAGGCPDIRFQCSQILVRAGDAAQGAG